MNLHVFPTPFAAAAVVAFSAAATAGNPDSPQEVLRRMADAYKANPAAVGKALDKAARGDWPRPAPGAAPLSAIEGRWLIYKKLAPLEAGYRETFVNFTHLIGPLGLIQSDLAEIGFSIDDLLPIGVPTVAFKLGNDTLSCNAVYVGFKPPEPANQVVGLMFCTDGSGRTGDWSGCDNPINEVPTFAQGWYCPGLPLCSYTDPNCL